MKNIITLLCLAIFSMSFISCNDIETYAEKKDRENAAIAKFVAGNTEVAKKLFGKPVKVISEDEFKAKGYTTDVTQNEFVLFESSGVYLQIQRQGCGKKIESGDFATVLCRFHEYNIMGDSLQLTNQSADCHYMTDKMSVSNSYGTFTGSFEADVNQSLMYATYQSASVPSGWLVPLRFLNIGRQSDPSGEIAKVGIIVPSSQGQYSASASTYPCYYVITYERGIMN